MTTRNAGTHGSVGPNDEVMPYSDDETDDELDVSTDEEEEEPVPGAPPPPVEIRPSGEACDRFGW